MGRCAGPAQPRRQKAQLGGLLLRSLVELSRSRVRGIEVMPIDATGKA
jgi:hypothetical protein